MKKTFCKTFCTKRKKKSCTAAANLPAARLRRRTSPRCRPSVASGSPPPPHQARRSAATPLPCGRGAGHRAARYAPRSRISIGIHIFNISCWTLFPIPQHLQFWIVTLACIILDCWTIRCVRHCKLQLICFIIGPSRMCNFCTLCLKCNAPMRTN